jgi:1,4-alpha-glucan branching enzyme
VHGGRENLEAISLLKRINETLGAQCPGAITIAEESTTFPGVSSPTYSGGLGFHYKWNMGWMHDTLQYMREDPVHRRWHHDKITFGLSYAFSENFVLALSHDEVVHGKGSVLGKMPGDRWQQFANLRAYYGFMWGYPGKKLLFMGQEFAQSTEWNYDSALPWLQAEEPEHAGVRRLIGDLNRLYTSTSALHQLDCSADGFEWIEASDAEQSVFAWLRRDMAGEQVLVVCNFTPVPRHGYRLGVPVGDRVWHELLNTDHTQYGGSGVVNLEPLPVEPVVAQGLAHSIRVALPPLGTLFLSRSMRTRHQLTDNE